MWYPLQFDPIYQERIWGGRFLERLYGRVLPPAAVIGESWEISDRPEAQSRIRNGPWAGRTLQWLVANHSKELMGRAALLGGRFPLLVKILDARQKLSLQVHPPADKARALNGEAKTELWLVTEAEPGAELYVGLRKGTTRAEFERRVQDGTVAECFHRIPVRPGDAMFLPSGRVHAIGAGLTLFEIQQNSDTTYRVFDWNRVDASGRPRTLHVAESLECIDFDDFEPPLLPRPSETPPDRVHVHPLVNDPLFQVDLLSVPPGVSIDQDLAACCILGVIQGEARLVSSAEPLALSAGQFCLLPAALQNVAICSPSGARLLRARPGYFSNPS